MTDKYLDFAIDIAKIAGDVMRKYFNADNGAEYKYDNSIVTIADKEINDYLIERVSKEFPTHSVQGEEMTSGESDYVWVCDPVDGTAVFARHIPIAVFSLALVVKGEPIIGVIYDPWTDSMYTAIKGQGAYKNNIKLQVNDYTLQDIRSVGNCDIWLNAGYDITSVMEELSKGTYFISLGSVIRACCCVASGDFVCAIFPGTKNKNYDIAAVKVIVEEAGGRVTDFAGNEQRYDRDINGAIISNGVVHNEILQLIKSKVKKK